jgi:seryl-tRNA synthetase
MRSAAGLQRELDEIRRRQNEGSDRLAELSRAGQTPEREKLLAELKGLAEEKKRLEERLSQVEAELEAELLSLPNIPHDSVPPGTKEEKVILRTWGEPPKFDFPPQHHVALAQRLGLLDLERAARLAGSRFPMYVGEGARLECRPPPLDVGAPRGRARVHPDSSAHPCQPPLLFGLWPAPQIRG